MDIPQPQSSQTAPPYPIANAPYQPQYILPPAAPQTAPGFPTPQPPPAFAPMIVYYLGTQIHNPELIHTTMNIEGYDPTNDFHALRKATKGFGTDDNALISVLAPLTALQVEALSAMFLASIGKSMLKILEDETSRWFKETLRGIALGPLGFDVDLVHQAISGLGTNEEVLIEILLGRSRYEIELLKRAYQTRYSKSLEDDVKNDLSGELKRIFTMAFNVNDNQGSVDPASVQHDVTKLYEAGQGKVGTDEIAFCTIIINSSREHLGQVITEYGNKYKSLTKVIKAEFSGTLRKALLYVVNGAKPKRLGKGIAVWRDAKLMEAAMAGFGTNDKMLVCRVVRAHWDRQRMALITTAFQERYRKSLVSRIEGETSGSYRKLLVALVNGK